MSNFDEVVEMAPPPLGKRDPHAEAAAQEANLLHDEKTIDNWRHRSKGMKCETCMWYVPKGEYEGSNIGRCRRHSPTMSGWPVMFATDWCGDHKLDEASQEARVPFSGQQALADAVIESRQSVP